MPHDTMAPLLPTQTYSTVNAGRPEKWDLLSKGKA